MEIILLISIINTVLLLFITVLLFMVKSKSNISILRNIIKKSGDEQRDSVARQINSNATEQFERFVMIQESIQTTLRGVFWTSSLATTAEE